MAETIVQKKKGTAKTEQIIGTGLAKVDQSIKGLKSAVAELETLAGIIEKQSLQIADNQLKISELDVNFKEEKRQRTVQLEQDMKEQGLHLATGIFLAEGKLAIHKDELSSLTARATKNEEESKNALNTAVAIATSAQKSKYESDLKVLQAEQKAAEAQNNAKLAQSEAQIKFLAEQVVMWKTQLEEQRKAETERSKNQAVGTINVSSAK